jgi:hypothetical protein
MTRVKWRKLVEMPPLVTSYKEISPSHVQMFAIHLVGKKKTESKAMHVV